MFCTTAAANCKVGHSFALRMTDGRRYRSFGELQAHVEEFLDQIYHRVLHSALNYQSPVEFENSLGQSGAKWSPAALSFPKHKEVYSDDV